MYVACPQGGMENRFDADLHRTHFPGLNHPVHLDLQHREALEMNTTRAWVAGVAAAIGACGGVEPLDNPQFEVNAGDYGGPIYEAESPRGSGEFVTVNNSVVDPVGLAGLEVEVVTPDGVGHLIEASDFIGRPNQVYGPVSFDGYGEVRFVARIRQHGALVAEGRIAWTVDPDGHDGWEIVVARIPPPQYHIDITAPEPCGAGFSCTTAARFEIDEAARNYPEEALWLIVRRDDWDAIWE